jgi:hypothetical protein
MFSVLPDKFHETVFEIADRIINEDRERYAPVINHVRTVLKDDPKIIISGLLNEPDINIEQLDVYTTHTRRTATLITNQIHKKFGKFTQMREIIPLEEYDIMFDMRSLVKVYRIERYKTVSLVNLFNPIKYNNLYYFPPNIELMNIYHKLYRPNNFDEWDELLKHEKLLYKTLISTKHSVNLTNLNKDVSIANIKLELMDAEKATATTKTSKTAADCDTCKHSRKINIAHIKQLMLKFLHNEKYVLIGDWGYNIITKDPVDSDDKIQIISETDIEQDYASVITYLSQYTKMGIYYKKKEMFIPKDNRIFKHTFYIKYPTLKGGIGVDKPFLDIYNNGSFELIPYVNIKKDGVNLRVGNPYVQMRFTLMDLWIMSLLHHLKVITAEQLNSKTYQFIIKLKALHAIDIKYDLNYTGVNFDEKVAQKIEISEKNIKKTSYYPELSLVKDKKYKLIATS